MIHPIPPAAVLVAVVLSLTGLAGIPATPAVAAPAAPATITDVNGDGKADIVSIFQAPMTDLAAYDKEYDGVDGNFGPGFEYVNPGSVSVSFGGADRVDTVTQEQLGDSKGRVYWDVDGNPDWLANSWSGTFGDASLVADLNRDGYSDIVLGNPGENHEAGEVWVLWGSADGISASHATRILQGASAGDLVGDVLAYLAKPNPVLVAGDTHQNGGKLSVYPVGADGQLGAARELGGLPLNYEDDSYSLAASDDLLVIGAADATASKVEGAGAVVIARLQTDGSWVRKTVSQNSAGVPGKSELYEGFGSSVSILNGYVAVSTPWEKVGSALESGEVQGFRVTGSGATIKVKVLPYLTPRNLGLFSHNSAQFLGYNVQVYRMCDGRYGVLMETGPRDGVSGKGVAVRAPFVTSSHCKPKVITKAGWGFGFMSVLRTNPDGTKAETALLNTKPRQLKLVTYGHTTVTKDWTAAVHPEFNIVVQAAG